MPYTLPLSVVVAFTVLQWRQVVQVLVRPDSVVDMGPGLQLCSMRRQLGIDFPHLIELLAVGPLRPLHMALQLGAVGRDHEERQCPRRARGFERPFKLTAAVN